jgi:uncharacterized protein with HEPN domain
MSRRDPRVTLRQILEHARLARELCSGKTLQEILANWQTRLAFERVMEILGEAVKRLPDDLRVKCPSVDWKGAAGMRDHVAHGYDVVDHNVLWKAVREEVPGLIATADKMLRDLEEGSEKPDGWRGKVNDR